MVAVLWDMDGVLVDSEPLYFAEVAEVSGRFGAVPTDLARRCHGRQSEEIWALLHGEASEGPAFADWNREVDARFVVRVADAPARDEAVDAVRWLAGRGVAQACVSNSNRAMVDAVLARCGLDGRFGATVSRDDVAAGKPDPEGYRRALAALGVAPDRALAVEDSETGMAAARAAGATVLGWPIDPTLELARAHAVVRDLRGWLETWLDRQTVPR